MADQRTRGIAWTDETWNPLRGCSRVSEGCRHCYAEAVAARRMSAPGEPYHGLAEMTPAGPRWTGRVDFVEGKLNDPMRWRRSKMVFVNSMSDLFHEAVDDATVDRIVAVMAVSHWHVFQTLTKRPRRMADYLADRRPGGAGRAGLEAAIQCAIEDLGPRRDYGQPYVWPLPNVWWGVSAEDQRTLDQRLPHLVRSRAHMAVMWLSAEPLIGEMTLSTWLPHSRMTGQSSEAWYEGLDWVVAGGESGAGCRPMDWRWPYAMLRECADRGVAFFMKQLGGHPDPQKGLDALPSDLRVRQYPKGGLP